MRKVFQVLIHNKPYWVWDIENREHEGHGDTIKTWWLYYNTETNLGPDISPAPDSKDFVPYHKWISRRLWDVRFVQTNTSKFKWDEWQFSNNTSCEMRCNGKLVYSFTVGIDCLDFAMAKAQYLQIVMSEHPFNFFEPETENGRKIWWKGMPATIKVKSNIGEIAVIPDYTTGIDKETWWKMLQERETKAGLKKKTDDDIMDDDDREESMRDDYINWGDALSDGHIDWFRGLHEREASQDDSESGNLKSE